MAYQIREGNGSLFVNDRKETEQQPDYTGNVRIGGVLYRLAAWSRTGASGTPYLSISANPDRPRDSAEPSAAEASRVPPAQAQEFGDDIPF
jgi:hypothetical protein